ncbi:hypothetical protein Drorol1_Dr00005454 [Drosera rotundifolia]
MTSIKFYNDHLTPLQTFQTLQIPGRTSSPTPNPPNPGHHPRRPAPPLFHHHHHPLRPPLRPPPPFPLLLPHLRLLPSSSSTLSLTLSSFLSITTTISFSPSSSLN